MHREGLDYILQRTILCFIKHRIVSTHNHICALWCGYNLPGTRWGVGLPSHQCVWFVWIILIIIVISLGQILLSYITNTSRTHAHTHLRTHTHTRTHSREHTHPYIAVAVQDVAVRWVSGDQTMTELTPHFRRFSWRTMAGRCSFKKTVRGRLGIRDSFGCFSRIKKCIGRIETRTRDRVCFQSIRTGWDISRYDRARIATCSLLTATDRQI